MHSRAYDQTYLTGTKFEYPPQVLTSTCMARRLRGLLGEVHQVPAHRLRN
jgi:hypothetical protein